MTQILDALPDHYRNRTLCSYHNGSGQIQVVCITNIPGWRFERVVFPGDRILFETVLEATLQIHSKKSLGTLQLTHIPCFTLRVLEKPELSSTTTRLLTECYR